MLYSLGLSGLLRERFTKRNITFHHVRTIYFFLPLGFTFLHGYPL